MLQHRASPAFQIILGSNDYKFKGFLIFLVPCSTDGLSCPGFLRPLGQSFSLLLGLVAPETTGQQDFVFLPPFFPLSSDHRAGQSLAELLSS